MTRWLAGAYDAQGRTELARLAVALQPHASTTIQLGPLAVSYTGAQPSPGAPLCLLDGCLDNAEQLRRALGAPEEVTPEQLLALAWRRWGRELPARMRGDFVLLVWDQDRREGLLARDQLGVRCLYLHDTPDGVAFASEVRNLLALLPQRPAPDPVSLAHWLALSDPPAPATLLAGVRRLAPGAMLLLDEDGVREQRYWTPRFAEPLSGGDVELAEQVRGELERAVRRRIDPDGPTGVLMSGGLDSASVAAVAAAQAPGDVRAYAGVFPGHPAVDETELVAELRATLGLAGATAEVRPGGLLASAVASAQAWEMPLVGWGDFWVLPLLRAAAQDGVRVVLGGDGGDELFGARCYYLADRMRAGHPLHAARLALQLPGAGYGPPRRDIASMIASKGLAGALPYRLHTLLSRPFGGGSQAPAWLSQQARRHLCETSDPLAWKRLDGPRWWANIAHGITQGVEETGVFEQQRRSAATAGLVARHPLFDLDLVELGLRQPPLATFDRFLNRPLLRAAMAGLLPDSVRLRPQKVVFDSLLVDCLAGPDAAAVRSLLTDSKAQLAAYLDVRRVERELLDSDAQRRANPFRWMWQVWRLCTAEIWLRAQADPASAPAPAGAAPPSPAQVLPSPAQVTLSRAEAGPTPTPYVFQP